MLDLIRHAYNLLTNVPGLIQYGGTLLVCTIVFVETGLFVGFFLPGDALLVTAGVFAPTGHLRLAALLRLTALCAIAGDQLGYWIGRRAGPALYPCENSLFFRKEHLQRAHDFYEKYGLETIVRARFAPIVRTFAPAVAGAAKMNHRRFFVFDVIGGTCWVSSMMLTGYFLSSAIPEVDKHIHIVIVIVVLLSIMPGVIELLRNRRRKRVEPSPLLNSRE